MPKQQPVVVTKIKEPNKGNAQPITTVNRAVTQVLRDGYMTNEPNEVDGGIIIY